NCHKLDHEEEDCRTRIPVARGNSLQNVTCFGCREKGHYMDKCPRGRNPQNKDARGGAYVMRTEDP
ncbi:reverse transcriptase domain-containing protein, partial [Tanacetum coccineum]